MKTIIQMGHEDAHNFLLKSESYCSIELPNYFNFNTLLSDIKNFLSNNNLPIENKIIRKCNNVNYTIYSNKDGRYAWRPLEIIHPLLYVDLVKKITEKENWNLLLERFKKFQENENIKCLSIPIESTSKHKDKASQILKWWEEVEQKSIELALEYNYLFHTDISDCYGSIYTHSISWAIHGMKVAKQKRNDKKLLGNLIDTYCRHMHYGQTNGIPQGSVLMDFIAEIVLGYADLLLTEKLSKYEIKDYKILRYRDDYRIFVKSPEISETILKCLTEILIDLGLKLNTTKTMNTNDIIINSIKEDKYDWILKNQEKKDLQKHLLIIHSHGLKFPNAGILIRTLNDYYNRLYKFNSKKIKNAKSLISIVTDIAYNSPRTIPVCASIISYLINNTMKEEERPELIKKIHNKFLHLPNMGIIEIWLQRITNPIKLDNIQYTENLCKLVDGKDKLIWNNKWIYNTEIKKLVNAKKIIDVDKLRKNQPVIHPNEIDIFKPYL